MRGLLIRVGIIAAIAIGAFVVRDKLSGNAGDLQVGDCFDQPSTVNTVVKDVQHHPCTDPHLAEVFFVGDYDVASTTYPTEDAFQSFVLDRCIGAFETMSAVAIQRVIAARLRRSINRAMIGVSSEQRNTTFAIRPG